jgi:23S rRNA (guanosine2251-2'-O)-methyltransferase
MPQGPRGTAGGGAASSDRQRGDERPDRRGDKQRRGVGGEQVEGRQAVRELLIAGTRRAHEIWIAGDADRAPIIRDIIELAGAARVPVRDVAKARFEKEARCEAPQGVLAKAAPLPEATLEDLARVRKGAPPPFLIACDGVTDPGNLGALLRSAEGAGATGVVLPRHRAANVTPAVTKAAAGAVEHLPIALVGGLPAAIAQLRELGVWVVGLDGNATSPLYDLPAADGPIALVFGAEGKGLSRLVRERCDAVVAITLLGHLASLNVAAAAAVACFEVARRRAVGG